MRKHYLVESRLYYNFEISNIKMKSLIKGILLGIISSSIIYLIINL